MSAVECPFSIEGEGEPLILIHGIGAARSIWRFLIPLLSQHFKVVSYDLRNHGQAPSTEPGYGLDDLVDDLEAVRQRCGAQKTHIAGHSLGGMIGPAYARRFPERVLSLALLSTAAGRSTEDQEKVWSVVHAMEQKGVANVLKTLTSRWFTDSFIENHPDIVQARLQQVMDTDPGHFLNVFRIYAATEMLPWLHEIATPTLVLTGENDGGCNPRLNRQIADRLPNSELVILPHYKHSILLEGGPEVAGHMGRFIKSLNNRDSISH